ncbi:MAG: alpha-ribazole phosphatase [Candidatus Omnitrophica bacterium]|nr:alpha-ribazole phosphatase [Candidatus Omnitrophota bacterium]
MKLILVRHGETEWVRMGRYQGSTDIPLNRRGFQQARAAAHAVKKERVIAVYSSELMRARETAKLIANSCQKRIIIDERLNEVSFGKWEGELHEEISSRFPKEAARWYSGRWSSRPPAGESLGSLDQRVSSFLGELLKKHSDKAGSCVVVTHGGPIRMFLVRLLEVSPKIFWSIRIDPASLSVFRIDRNWRELVLLNSLAHLNGLSTRRKNK